MKPAEELTRAYVLSGPEPVHAAALLIAQERRQDLVLDLAPRGRDATGDVAHDVGVGVEADEMLDIVSREPS